MRCFLCAFLVGALAVPAGAEGTPAGSDSAAPLYEARTEAMLLEGRAMLLEPHVTASEVYIRAAKRASGTPQGDEAIVAMGTMDELKACGRAAIPLSGDTASGVRAVVRCADTLTVVFSDLGKLFRLTAEERRMIQRSSRKVDQALAIMRDVALRQTLATGLASGEPD